MSLLAESDLKNLRFYADMFREHKWETPWIHWSVFHQTLSEVADRVQELEKRFREEMAMRDHYQTQAKQRLVKILEQNDLLREVAALDDGDDPGLWKYSDLLGRIKDYIEPPANPHASDCNSWLGEPCNCCVTGRPDVAPYDWDGQPEL